MEKLIIQRKIEVWIEEEYSVEKIDKENIDKALNYVIFPDDVEVLWETQKDLDRKIYDEEHKLIKYET